MTDLAPQSRRSWKGGLMNLARNAVVLAAATMLVVMAQASAATPTVSSYTVSSSAVPGADTGLVLDGTSVTVTATGSVCPYGTGSCFGPDGSASKDTTTSGFGGFVLPGAPAWGLVGRIGAGPWVQVGSGPTTLSGSGDLQFAVNDDLLVDNTGSFTVAVSYSSRSGSCRPGWGYGDAHHEHGGPPHRNADACYPGHGYGDKNHHHDGPPGHRTQPTTHVTAKTSTSGDDGKAPPNGHDDLPSNGHDDAPSNDHGNGPSKHH
jgi:hypothetical protein